MGAQLERILKAAGQAIDHSRPIIEINPQHFMVRRVLEAKEKARRNDWANIVFEQALLSEGGRLEDPAGFVKRLNELVLSELGSAPANTAKKPGKGPEKTPGKVKTTRKKTTARKKTAKK